MNVERRCKSIPLKFRQLFYVQVGKKSKAHSKTSWTVRLRQQLHRTAADPTSDSCLKPSLQRLSFWSSLLIALGDPMANRAGWLSYIIAGSDQYNCLKCPDHTNVFSIVFFCLRWAKQNILNHISVSFCFSLNRSTTFYLEAYTFKCIFTFPSH